MKENLEQIDPQTKFKQTQKQLLKQIKNTYKNDIKKSAGVIVRVVTNEFNGGMQSLLLTSGGSWECKIMMSGYSLGKKPTLETLLQEFADIKDEAYQLIATNLDEDTQIEIEQQNYLLQNKDKLTLGLIHEMEERIKELKVLTPTRILF